MSNPKITLYVDVVSPFAYLGYYALRVGGSHWIDELLELGGITMLSGFCLITEFHSSIGKELGLRWDGAFCRNQISSHLPYL